MGSPVFGQEPGPDCATAVQRTEGQVVARLETDLSVMARGAVRIVENFRGAQDQVETPIPDQPIQLHVSDPRQLDVEDESGRAIAFFRAVAARCSRFTPGSEPVYDPGISAPRKTERPRSAPWSGIRAGPRVCPVISDRNEFFRKWCCLLVRPSRGRRWERCGGTAAGALS